MGGGMRSRKINIIALVFCALLMPAFVLTGCCKQKHEHEFSDWVEIKEATCLEGGELRRDCLDCDYFETKPTEPLGHSFGEWEDQTLPTCESKGVQVRHCTRCGVLDTQTRETDKLNHVVFDKYLKDEHNHYKVCLDPDCGEIKSVEPHDKLGEGGSCSVCGFKQEMIDAVKFEKIDGKEEYRAAGYAEGYTYSTVEEIVIPDEYLGLPVTEIKAQAFCTTNLSTFSPLAKVSIGKNVKKIGTSAFWHCTNLEYVVFPNSLTEIGGYAFERCENLSTVRLNKNLKTIKEEAFWGCTTLSEIAFPKSLQTVGNYVFSTCSNLSSVKFNEGLKTLGVSAFYGCENLTNITLPKTLQSIGNSAFYNCTGLTDLNMQGDETVVDAYAFYGCTGLQNIDFGGVKKLGQQAFDGCIGLTDLTFSDSLEEIGYFTFYGCTNLENVNFGNVKIIGECAFSGCTSLNSAILPNSVEKVGNYAFYNCKSIKDIRVGDNIQAFGREVFMYDNEYGNMRLINANYYDGNDKMKYVGNEQNHYLVALVADSDIERYKAKDSTRLIAGRAFGGIDYAGCDSLTEIDTNNVVSIGRYGIAGCDNLETVRFGENLKVIEERAFNGDNKIKKVYAPSLEHWMKIYYDFSYVADEEVQYQSDSNPVYYGAELYLNNQLLENLEVPDSITEIYSCSFAGYKKLKSIKIGSHVAKINDYAFYECTEVETIDVDSQNGAYEGKQNCVIDKSSNTLLFGCKGSTIPNGVEHIAPYAFYDVVISSKQVVIPDSMLTIGKFSFHQTDLDSFTMGVNVQSIGADAFGRESVPQRDVYILDLAKWFDIDFENEDANPVAWGSRIFVNGEHITNGQGEGLVIPESVTEIKKWAFTNASVHDLSIHAGVTKIDPTAFGRMANLQRITLAEENDVYSLTQNQKGVVYTNEESKKVLLMSTTGSTLDFSQDDIQIIGDYALANRGVDNVILPTNLESIGNYSFQYTSITEITIPTTVTSLGNGVFNNCQSLTSITFSDPYNWKEIELDGSEDSATPVDFSTPSANVSKFKGTYSSFKKYPA